MATALILLLVLGSAVVLWAHRRTVHHDEERIRQALVAFENAQLVTFNAYNEEVFGGAQVLAKLKVGGDTMSLLLWPSSLEPGASVRLLSFNEFYPQCVSGNYIWGSALLEPGQPFPSPKFHGLSDLLARFE